MKNTIMNLELKHLAPYLPYRLNFKHLTIDKNLEMIGVENNPDLRVILIDGLYVCDYKILKPILRPLSDIDKQVWVNGVLRLPRINYDLVKDEEHIWCDEFAADYGESPSVKIPITSFNFWLFELHFDVFGLIEKGLAIDINSLESIE